MLELKRKEDAKEIDGSYIASLSQIYPKITNNTKGVKVFSKTPFKSVLLDGEEIETRFTVFSFKHGSLTKRYRICYNETEDVLFWWIRYYQ